MTAYEVIRRKRNGGELDDADIRWLVRSFLAGEIADYQMAAFLMAVYFVGMTERETESLTRAMLESGETLDLAAIPGPKIDKHSTGGVGDKLSLVVAPVAACLGVRVPMVSGRALGHTGGTLDKLESIPGLRTDLAPEAMLRVVGDVGMSVVGQSPRMAPADLRMYALRDVTATVECVPLIVASILSKKLAAGLDGLVLDVKVGRGAFMGDLERARGLAGALCSTAGRLGLRAVAVLTDMESPLGLAVGNSLEVEEAVLVLRGGGPADVRETSLELAARMALLGGRARDLGEARALAKDALESGRAFEVFLRFVEAQGGDVRFVDGRERLRRAPLVRAVPSAAGGVVRAIDALEVGLACVKLGAGRRSVGEAVDHAVGVVIAAPVGAGVSVGDPLAFVHADGEAAAAAAEERVRAAFRLASERQPERRTRVLEVIPQDLR
ncbi:MAG: thymidine phosphorylase [Candidatus Eisenbacteria bacterium]|nr:thymidine phosphorylase [Candidatus Eisenbacteria bacterium]